MTIDAVKKKIKETFGTYSKFTKLAGIDRYEFQRDFLQAATVSKGDIAEINGLVASLKDQASTPATIRSKMGGLKKALKEAGGVPAFCRANPDFVPGSVYAVLYGRLGYLQVASRLIMHFKL